MFGLFGSYRGIDKYFGDYNKPEILIKLEECQEKKLASWEALEFWISYDNHYNVTPVDVIPFAGTGSNGIHFGFLTDFNRVKDLGEALIVCVAPTYDPPVNIVAKNLQEFLSMVYTVQSAVLLADIYKDEGELQERIVELFEDDEYEGRRLASNKILEDQFDVIEIEKPISRILELKEIRKSDVGSSTLDGLGIEFNKEEPIDEFEYTKSVTDVKRFLSYSNLNSRIKFYRNSTFAYTLNKDYDSHIKGLIIRLMKKDGFKREAKILKENY